VPGILSYYYVRSGLVRRKSILGVIVQLAVSPKLMYFLIFIICEVKLLINLFDKDIECRLL
jgi:hypothetical protein